MADHTEREINTEDLDAWITFSPWENPFRENQYLEAVSHGLIPSRKYIWGFQKQPFYKAGFATFVSTILDLREHLLPSQQLQALQKGGKAFNITIQVENKYVQIPMTLHPE